MFGRCSLFLRLRLSSHLTLTLCSLPLAQGNAGPDGPPGERVSPAGGLRALGLVALCQTWPRRQLGARWGVGIGPVSTWRSLKLHPHLLLRLSTQGGPGERGPRGTPGVRGPRGDPVSHRALSWDPISPGGTDGGQAVGIAGHTPRAPRFQLLPSAPPRPREPGLGGGSGARGPAPAETATYNHRETQGSAP